MKANNRIRNSAKAIIIKDNKLLVIKSQEGEGTPWYVLPGGGQGHEETLHDALIRECHEELNSNVKVKKLVLVREYIGKNHEFAEVDGGVHQIDFFFECELTSPLDQIRANIQDAAQVDIEWLPLKTLHEKPLFPKMLVEEILSPSHKIYHGDIN